MSDSNHPLTVSELAEAHLLGQLNGEQIDALNDLLLRDADARKRCALAFETMSMVHEEFRRREENAEMHAGEPLLKDFDAVSSNLLQMEQNAEVVLRTEPSVTNKPARQQADEAGSLSLRDYVSVGGYALRKAVTSKPVIHTGMGAAAAAVLLLGLFLFNPFANDTPDPIAEATNSSDLSIDVPAILTNQVATLTATHNAAWSQDGSERALARGSALHPGDRLTLTVGFAEITTNRGAIATLEAPCTIEMIDRDNGLELIQGKLVGHCPTRQSQGFLVRTPSTQVIDLGTEFGVEVDAAGVTDVYVFTGLVALADLQDDPRVAELTEVAAGQGKRVDRQGQKSPLTKADIDKRFVRSIDPNNLYEHLVLTDQPLVYYRMDNVIGGIEYNRAADRYHAKVFGGVTAITEAGRSSISLNAPGDFLQTSESITELRGSDSYTIECWLRAKQYGHGSICEIIPTNWDNPRQGAVAARLETLDQVGIGRFDGKRLRFAHKEKLDKERDGDSSLGTNTISKSDYPLDRWVHVAAVKSVATMTLYLNGRSVDEIDESTGLVDTELSIRIGKFFGDEDASPKHLRQFIGQLDEFAIYNHALPAQAIRARVSAGQHWSKPSTTQDP